jgi:hypothetical protein
MGFELPVEQLRHFVEPAVDWYFPAGQLVQNIDPESSE